jgi:integrase/recombinase XerD
VNWKEIGAASRTTRKKQEATDGKRIHPLSEEEVEKLKATVPDPKIRNELMIRLMLQTGMRAGELARLKLDNVNQENHEIYIDESKSEARTVGYQPSLSMLMDQWIHGGHRDVVDTDDSPYLFPTRQSQRIKINRINDVVKTAAEEAGIQEELYEDANGHTRYRITSHSLRHTFAIMALSPSVGERSLNIGYLRDVMGHEDISTTQEYLQYLNEDAVESMKMAGPSL